MKNLIRQFNKPDTLLVITSYPTQDGEPAKQNAVACYAQNLLNDYKNRKIVVLSELNHAYHKNKKGKPQIKKQGNLLIVRCWQPTSPFLFFQLTRSLRHFNKPQQVLVQFEFNMLGSVVLTSLLPGFLAWLRFLGKRITIVQHQVIEDLSLLSGHLNIKSKSFKNLVFTNGLHLFYRGLGFLSDKIIVHEEILKERLAKWVKQHKLHVISHGLSLENTSNGRLETRQELGIKKDDLVLLLFGYITWYKGSDWLVSKVSNILKNNPKAKLKLIIAGGASATLSSKSHYRKFVKRVQNLAQASDSIIITGFISEKDVAKYFAASDLVVLPYRTMMSASGPLSFALRFNKPILVSSALSQVMQNQDIKQTLAKVGIQSDELTFKLKGNSFEQKIDYLLTNQKALIQLNKVSGYLRKLRNWKNIVIKYNKVINQAEKPVLLPQLKSVLARGLSRPMLAIRTYTKAIYSLFL